MEYQMSPEQLRALMDEINRHDPVMVFGDHVSGSSPQERANSAWEKLGNEMGFQNMTVQPISGKGDEFFTADPK